MKDASIGIRKGDGFPDPEKIFKKAAAELVSVRKALSLELLGERVGTIKAIHGRTTHERNK